MALRATVKVGNITNLSDARYCAGMGVELLGFNINPDSEDYVNPETFHAIKGWIEGVKYVLEYNGDELPDVENYDFDYLEITDPSLIPNLDTESSKIILRVNSDESELNSIFSKYGNAVSYFDLYSPSNNLTIEESFQSYPILLGNGVDKSNVNDLLDKFPSIGISLKGTREIKPGFKDYDELADILEEIEVDY